MDVYMASLREGNTDDRNQREILKSHVIGILYSYSGFTIEYVCSMNFFYKTYFMTVTVDCYIGSKYRKCTINVVGQIVYGLSGIHRKGVCVCGYRPVSINSYIFHNSIRINIWTSIIAYSCTIIR